MPIRLDAPPPAAARLINASIAPRLRESGPLGLDGSVVVTRPLARRYFTISSGAHPAFRLKRLKSWDYFVLSETAVAIASLREDNRSLMFKGLSAGERAERLLQGVRIAENELRANPERLVMRLFECRAARLLSVVVRSRSGPGYYLNVVDRSLLPVDALTLMPDIQGLRDLAEGRLKAARKKVLRPLV